MAEQTSNHILYQLDVDLINLLVFKQLNDLETEQWEQHSEPSGYIYIYSSFNSEVSKHK